MTQRNTDKTLLWLREQHDSGSAQWYQQCLRLTRTARNIGPMFPSAISAQHSTPEKYRVHKLDNVKRGMVAYFDDPNDDNPFGHVVTVQGRHVDNSPFSWTNDVIRGKVSLVPMNYFPTHWGDSFQFAATWLNGVELDMPDGGAVQQVARPNIDDAIASLTKVIEQNAGDTRLVSAMKRDRATLVTHKKRFG